MEQGIVCGLRSVLGNKVPRSFVQLRPASEREIVAGTITQIVTQIPPQIDCAWSTVRNCPRAYVLAVTKSMIAYLAQKWLFFQINKHLTVMS